MTEKKKSIIILSLACTSVFGSCIYISIPPLRQHFHMLNGLKQEIHPVWRVISKGKIYPGQNVDDAFKQYKPSSSESYGPYTFFYFRKNPSPDFFSYSGLQVLAKDGKLIRASASSCAWSKTFFDEMTEADNSSLRKQTLEARENK